MLRILELQCLLEARIAHRDQRMFAFIRYQNTRPIVLGAPANSVAKSSQWS